MLNLNSQRWQGRSRKRTKPTNKLVAGLKRIPESRNLCFMYDMLWNVQLNMVVLRKSMCNFIFLFYFLSFYFLKASRLQVLRFSYPYNEIFRIHFNWAYNCWSIFNQNSISRQPMFREGWCCNIAPCNLRIFDCRLYPRGGKFEPCLAGVGNLNQKCRPSRGIQLFYLSIWRRWKDS